jgi:hypothetical protein
MKRFLCVSVAISLLLFAAACGSDSNSTSSTATVSAPTPVSPAVGAVVKYTDQPITLVLNNATTTGTTPLTYSFEVSSDVSFTTGVVTKSSVAQGTTQTSVKLDAALTGSKTYYWRARAASGTTFGPYSSIVTFLVGSAIDLQAPQPYTPANGETVGSTKPTFTIVNASRTGSVGTIYYLFEVSDNSGFSPNLQTATVQEQSGGYTAWTPTSDLPAGKNLYWHVRTTDPANNVQSSFSNTRSMYLSQGVDLKTVVYVKGPDISGWPQTSTITSVNQGDGWLCIYHTALGFWPATQYMDTDATVEGNQWIIANINGRWYAGAADWYRPGQACKAQDANSMGGDNFYNASEEPLHSWVPRPGEQIGYAASTPARMWPYMATKDERTNVVIVPWK